MAVELVTSISMFLIEQLLPTLVRRKNTVAKLLNSLFGSILYSYFKQYLINNYHNKFEICKNKEGI